MSNISDLKAYITEEEVRYKSAVSESTFFKMGGAINWINNRIHHDVRFTANGFYPASYTGLDGLVVFEFDIEIFGVSIYNLVAGSSGQVEFDVKRIATGFPETSIFSVRPFIKAAAGNNKWTHPDIIDMSGNTNNGTLSITQLNAGQALRCDIVSGQTNGKNAGLIIFYRAR